MYRAGSISIVGILCLCDAALNILYFQALKLDIEFQDEKIAACEADTMSSSSDTLGPSLATLASQRRHKLDLDCRVREQVSNSRHVGGV